MVVAASLCEPTFRMKVGHWMLGKTLGEGTFGKVKLGVHLLTGERVAVKVLEKDRITDKGDVKRVTREIQILKHMQHPHIVNLLEVVERPRHIFLVTEYVAGGELFEFIVAHGRLQETQACRIFRQILVAVDACHAYGVAHRDLKPENVLIDENCNVKLIDFGLSNMFDGPSALLRTACGSPCYAAPEMIAGKRYKGSCADLWSLGVCLFAMLCGFLPFEDPDTPSLYQKILAGAYQVADHVSAEARSLLAGLLTTDPARRFTVADVYKHPWFARRCAEPLVPLLTMHPEMLASMTSVSIDPEILDELEGLGISREYCVQCLTERKRNHTTAAYYLLQQRQNRLLQQTIARPGSKVHAAAAATTPPVGATAALLGASSARTAAEHAAAATAGADTGGAWSARVPGDGLDAAARAPPSKARPATAAATPAADAAAAAQFQPHPPLAPRPPAAPNGANGAPPRRPHPRSKQYVEAAQAATHVAYGGVHAMEPAPPSFAGKGGAGVYGGGGAAGGAPLTRPTTAGAVPSGQSVRTVEVKPLSHLPGGRAGAAPAHPRSAHGVKPNSARDGAPASALFGSAYAAPPRRPLTAREGTNTAARRIIGVGGTALAHTVPGAGAGAGFGAGTGAGRDGGAAGLSSPMSAPTQQPPKQLMAEAVRQLESAKMSITMQSPFIARCEAAKLSFLAEVAATDASQKWFVVRLQFQRGDGALFREVASRLLPALVQ